MLMGGCGRIPLRDVKIQNTKRSILVNVRYQWVVFCHSDEGGVFRATAEKPDPTQDSSFVGMTETGVTTY